MVKLLIHHPPWRDMNSSLFIDGSGSIVLLLRADWQKVLVELEFMQYLNINVNIRTFTCFHGESSCEKTGPRVIHLILYVQTSQYRTLDVPTLVLVSTCVTWPLLFLFICRFQFFKCKARWSVLPLFFSQNCKKKKYIQRDFTDAKNPSVFIPPSTYRMLLETDWM